MTAAEIAEQLGVSRQRVYALLKLNRLRRVGDTWEIVPGKPGTPPKLRQSQSEIARQLGVSRDHIGDMYRASRLRDEGGTWRITKKDEPF